jgi:hypothetical protein
MIAPLIPESLVYFLYNYFPSRGLQKYRDTRVLFEGFAKSLIASKTEELNQGRNGRDVMSLLGLHFRYHLHTLAFSYIFLESSTSECVSQHANEVIRPRAAVANAVRRFLLFHDRSKLEVLLFSFFSTIMLAGHETVSNTMSFSLLELAKHPEIQRKLRDEIRETRAKRGNVELNVEDFDCMPYLSAFIKVCVCVCVDYHLFFKP